MSTLAPLSDPVFVAYVLAFGAAAGSCFVALRRARRVDDPDTRRGLVALLLTSGGWATAHVAYFLVPTPQLKLVFYQLGLIVGISAVGPWLYFCSAYTGRSLHRAPALRRLAGVLFVGIVALKVTNPFHHRYFHAAMVSRPFRYLAIQRHLLHWVVMGLAYALATVGIFMLLELFWEVDHDTTPLAVLVGLTGLPVVLDIVSLTSSRLITITYEPLGVAAFAVGVLFIYVDDFRTVQLAGESENPVIVLDEENRIRDANASAQALVPERVIGDRIETALPRIADALEADEDVIELEGPNDTRYYQLSTRSFSTDRTRGKRTITLTDITEREQYRAEVERQNERLERFASMVSHDLRNPLNVAVGRLALAQEEYDSEHLDAATTALNRMETLIEDLLALAREGRPIDRPERVSLSTVVNRSWDVVATEEATLTVERDVRILADPGRLQQLFENLFRNAIEHGGDAVTIRVGDLPDRNGFYVADDGPGIPEDERTEVFDSGYTTADEGTGFGLAIVTEIVDAHGWEVTVTDSDAGGARFEIRGVEITE